MAGMRLSKRTVDALEPRAARFIAWDSELPGFGCEVHPSGLKTFKLLYRHDGRRRRLTLGRHGAITPDEARDLAKRALGAVAHGADPAGDKSRARTATRMSEAFPRWLDVHVDAKRKGPTRTEYRRIWQRNIEPQLGRRAVADVSRADVTALHRRMADKPFQANKVLRVLSSFFTWCERQGLRPDHSNPARLVETYTERPRERMLSDDEYGRLRAAVDAAERDGEWPWAIAAIRLIMFTGARRGEILGLNWSEIDLERGTARLPDSKTGPKTLYLSAPARDVLAAVPRVAGNPHVICGRNHGGSLVGLPAVWRRVRARAGLPDLRIHDLRHAFASAAAMSGVPLLTIGRLLGHSQPAVTDRYAHLAASRLVSAADGVAGLIAGSGAASIDAAAAVPPVKAEAKGDDG